MVYRCERRDGAAHGKAEAVATAAGLRVTMRGLKVVADAIGCGTWTLKL
jgi:hypothetical protein